MLGTFCLRLASGIVACLLLLSPRQINPRFFRTQFLVSLSLTGLAALTWPALTSAWSWAALGVAAACSLLGALSWSLEGAPAGKTLIPITACVLLICLVLSAFSSSTLTVEADGALTTRASFGWSVVDEVSSAALLGAAMSAMLLGHFYLIAPGMALTPLLRLLGALFVAVALRAAIAGSGLFFWTRGHSLGNLDDIRVLWLPVRWVVGIAGPLVLGWMARESAKIRSTQSATGILYVVVIFCFLGELTGLLLRRDTGFVL